MATKITGGFISIDGVASTGAGTAQVVEGWTYTTLQTVRSTTVGGAVVVLEGSLDGSNYNTILTSSSTSGGTFASSTHPPYTYVRAKITTFTTSTSTGTDGAVTAYVAGV